MDWQIARTLRNTPYQDEFKYLFLLPDIKNIKKKKEKIIKVHLPSLGVLCTNLKHLMGIGQNIKPYVLRIIHRHPGTALNVHIKMLLGIIIVQHFKATEVLDKIGELISSSNSEIMALATLTPPPSPRSFTPEVVPLYSSDDGSSPSPRKHDKRKFDEPSEKGELPLTPRRQRLRKLPRRLYPESITMADDDSSICSQDIHYLRDFFTTITEFDDYQRIDEEDLLKCPSSPRGAHNKVQYELSSLVNKDTPWQLLTENLLTCGPSDEELMGLCEKEFNRCFEKRVARSPILLVPDIPLAPHLLSLTHPEPLSLAPPVVAEEPGHIPSTVHSPVLAGLHVPLDPLLPPFPVYSDLPGETSVPPSQQWDIRRPLSEVPVELESSQGKRRKVNVWTKKIRTGRREIGARILRDYPSGIIDFTRNPDLIERVRPPTLRDRPRRDNRTRGWLTQDLNWDLTRNEPLRLDEILDVDEPMEEGVVREQPQTEERDEPTKEPEELSWSNVNIVDTVASYLAAHPEVEDINYILKDIGTNKMPYIEDDGIEEGFPPDFRLKRAPLISLSVLMRYPDWAKRGQPSETHDEAHSGVALHQTVLESGGPSMPEERPTTSADIRSRTLVQQMQDISVVTGPSVAGSAAFSSIGSDLRPLVPDMGDKGMQGPIQEELAEPRTPSLLQHMQDEVLGISDVTMPTVIHHPVEEEMPTVEQPMPPEAEVPPVVVPGEMPPPPPPPPRRPRRRNVPRFVYIDGSEVPRPRRRRRPRPVPEREPTAPQVDQPMEAVEPQPPFLQDGAPMALVEAARPAEHEITKSSDAEPYIEMIDAIPPDVTSSNIWNELSVREVLKGKVKITGMVLRFSDCCEVGVCNRRSAASFFSALLRLCAKNEIQLWQTESSGDPTKIFIKLLVSD